MCSTKPERKHSRAHRQADAAFDLYRGILHELVVGSEIVTGDGYLDVQGRLDGLGIVVSCVSAKDNKQSKGGITAWRWASWR